MGAICTKQNDVVNQKLQRPQPSSPSCQSQGTTVAQEGDAASPDSEAVAHSTSPRVAERSETENACPILEEESRQCLRLDDDSECPKASRGPELCDEDEDGHRDTASVSNAAAPQGNLNSTLQHHVAASDQCAEPCSQLENLEALAPFPDPEEFKPARSGQLTCKLSSTLPQETAALCAEVEQCLAEPMPAMATSASPAPAPSQSNRALARTPSNASSIVSASHIAAGLQTPPSSSESPFSGLASPRRKTRPPFQPHQQQQQHPHLQPQQAQPQVQHPHQQRSQSVPKRPSQIQHRALPMLPSKLSAYSDYDAYPHQPKLQPVTAYRKEVDPAARRPNAPQAASIYQQKRPTKKPGPSCSSSKLSKAAAFAAAAVVRSVPLQYPNYPKYPTPPASTHSAISEEPGLQPLNESLESMKELGESLDWSELSSSLPPSCFGTARASRVLDSGEVNEMLGGCFVGADAAAAAQRLHSLVDGCRSDSSASSSATGHSSSSRLYPHQPGPSLHQHIYPGCPFPLTSGSQKPAVAAIIGMGNSRLSGLAQPAAAVPAVSAQDHPASPHAMCNALSSVAEEQDSRQTSRQESECSSAAEANGLSAAGAKQEDSARLISHMSISSLPANPSVSQDILGVSDLSSVAILAK